MRPRWEAVLKLKHRIEWGLVRSGLSLGNLFPWSWISATGAALGVFVFHVLRMRRRVVLENLHIALGGEMSPDELRRIAARCYRVFGRTHLEYFGLPALGRRRVLERITVEGIEHLEAARAEGRGVILLMSHFGNWEMLGLMGRRLGLDVHLLVGDLSNSSVDEGINRMRERLGLKILRRGMALRTTMQLLKKGGTVLFPGDQEARWHGVTVPMFGRATLTHPGAAHFALKTGAAILMGFPIREGIGFRMRFLPPLIPEGEADDEGIRRLTARHTAVLESMVREHPEQWFWMHRRWKAAPKGGDGLPERMDA